MTLTSAQLAIGFLMLLLALIAHTGALFYWGGKTKQLLDTHSQELKLLREWKHDDVQQDLTDLKLRVGLLEQDASDK